MASKHILDPHCELIMEEYRENIPLFNQKMEEISSILRKSVSDAGLIVAALESRVKGEDSLAGKLELKGSKYKTLADITDIIGIRVITFYVDDVDKVASAVERLFKVDWENSVDKRKIHEIDSFGYMSLHYICSMEGFPYRFEVQMRTVLQHAWSNMNHDTGYKSGVSIPTRYIRNLSRLAGMLELIDDEFTKMRQDLTDYRRKVKALVASGNLSEVLLDEESYRSFLELGPFDNLNRRIASVNQAEIQAVSLMPYLPVFVSLGFKTLGDIEKLLQEYSGAAFEIATFQMGLTDLDILSSSVGPQNLCIAYVLKNGGGKAGLVKIFDVLGGEHSGNEIMAQLILDQAKMLPFMNQ